ncbi:MAG TPA: hypothetical protein VJH88_05630, partial [Candidatus Nanoarchaeia archaeon]|nr:hypothetical protein [Candidatus Nanoarchaeia archaeon]
MWLPKWIRRETLDDALRVEIVQQVPGTKFVSCSQPANDRQVASVIATLGNTSGRLNGIEVAQAHLF